MKRIKLFALSLLLGVLHMGNVHSLAQGIGGKITDFKLKSTSGNMVSMADKPNAKGYIVVFISNYCPFVDNYDKRLIALHRQYAGLGFPVLAINANDANKQAEESFEGMITVVKQKAYPFPYLHDDKQVIARRFGASRNPQAFVVQKIGSVYSIVYKGAIDDNVNNASLVNQRYLEDAVNDLIAGRPIRTPETTPMGCGIKWF